MMTLRMDADLHKMLKERAEKNGRSTSAEVTQLLRLHVSAKPVTSKPPAPSMGMFSQYEAPDLDELHNDGAEIAALFLHAVKKRGSTHGRTSSRKR